MKQGEMKSEEGKPRERLCQSERGCRSRRRNRGDDVVRGLASAGESFPTAQCRYPLSTGS